MEKVLPDDCDYKFRLPLVPEPHTRQRLQFRTRVEIRYQTQNHLLS